MAKKIFAFASIILLLAAAAYLTPRYYSDYVKGKEKRLLLKKRKASWAVLKDKIEGDVRGFNGEVAFVIKDLDTGTELRLNQERLFPSASLVKVPVMAACFLAESEGHIRFDEKIKLKKSDKVSGSGLLKDEPAGKDYTIERLIELMVAESDNTAANMLTGRLGMRYLNGCFKKMGLKGTNLSRVMMDFDSRKAGIENYTSARDISYLLENICRGRFISKDVSKKCLTILAMQKVNDRIPKKLPPGTVVAHKTGLENGICHDAGIAYTGRSSFLICVLTKHRYKTARPSKKLIADISFAVYDSYKDG